MKNRVLKNVVMLTMVCALIGMSINVDAKCRKTVSKTSVKSISEFATKLRNMASTPQTIDEYATLKEKIDNLARAYSSASSGESRTHIVLNKVNEYAKDKLESGSTMDMMDAGYIHMMSHTYNAASTFGKMLKSAPSDAARNAIKAEAQAWLDLQQVLQDYCTSASYIFNYGGSLAGLSSTGAMWNLAEIRDKDLSTLLKNGFVNEGSAVNTSKAVDNATMIVTNMNNRGNSLIDMDEEFIDKETLQHLHEMITKAMKDVSTLMPRWIQARHELLQYAKDKDSAVAATDRLLEAIDNITCPGEGEG